MRKKIVIAEDEKGLRDLLCLNLLKEGFDIISVVEDEDALEVIDKFAPDLFITNNILTCKNIRKNSNLDFVKIILLSSKNSEEEVIEALDFGVDDSLVRPFSFSILRARINVLFRNELQNYKI